jgi:hypothetical protein
MGLTVADAYAQIKQLENSGQITLPETQDTVVMGTIDPKAGTFSWSQPTVVQTTVIPPGPGQKTNTIINVTMGVVGTKAVDLLLKFNVIPQQLQIANAPLAMSRETLTKLAPTAATASAVEPTKAAPAAAANVAEAAAVTITGVGVVGETNGGVTITGFPTVSSAANEITVDAGLVCSTITGSRNVTPPVSSFSLAINIPGHPAIDIQFFILRPPVVGMGAFTIPALPMTIVYAPPQGKLLKNTMTYADTETLTRTVTSAVTTSNNTKTAQAYTAADLISKVAGAITAVVAVVGTGGAGAAGGASVAGAMSELGSALFGGAQTANDSAADAAKQVSSELSLVSTVLTAVDTSTSSGNGTLTVENDNTLTLALSFLNQWSSDSALGPGVGDRIVYMTNMKVVWVAVNGEVGIHILGFDGFGANAVQDLQQELHSITTGGASVLGLDADTIRSLLSQDPLVNSGSVAGAVRVGPPLIGPPRFLPAQPPGRTGTGSSTTQGDLFQASFDATSETKSVTTNSQTTITDAKPGWVSVLFGGDNVETTTTATFTTSQTTDDKTEDKIVSSITLFSEGLGDQYDVKIFYDCTFGTYTVVNSNSSVLQGVTLSNTLENSARAN